eukprot:scaffold27367_cov112-Isochrysis_galbana.AAC.12
MRRATGTLAINNVSSTCLVVAVARACYRLHLYSRQLLTGRSAPGHPAPAAPPVLRFPSTPSRHQPGGRQSNKTGPTGRSTYSAPSASEKSGERWACSAPMSASTLQPGLRVGSISRVRPLDRRSSTALPVIASSTNVKRDSTSSLAPTCLPVPSRSWNHAEERTSRSPGRINASARATPIGMGGRLAPSTAAVAPTACAAAGEKPGSSLAASRTVAISSQRPCSPSERNSAVDGGVPAASRRLTSAIDGLSSSLGGWPSGRASRSAARAARRGGVGGETTVSPAAIETPKHQARCRDMLPPRRKNEHCLIQ